ncbi:MAG: prolipoprotein diacylglyceryl transferase [Candidatus Woesearchaeota archaeon]
MIYHNFSPIVFEIFGLKIRWYGIAWSFGFLLTYLILKKYHKFAKISNSDKVEEYVIILILFLLITTKIFVILHDLFLGVSIDLDYFKGLIFSGFSAIGSFIGVILGIIYLKRVKKENFDLVSLLGLILIGLIISSSIGRIANFLNKEFYGIKSNAWFCVVFFENDYCRIPVQIFESIYYLFLSIVLILFLHKINKNSEKSDQYKWTLLDIGLYGYGIGRFMIEFLKEMPKVFFSLNTTQIEIFFILFIYTLLKIFQFKKTKKIKGENIEKTKTKRKQK